MTDSPRQILLLAMSDHHSGNNAEAQKIVDAQLSALEASGWRLVHPEKISLSMTAKAVEARDIHDHNIGEQIAAAIIAAPTYGAPQ